MGTKSMAGTDTEWRIRQDLICLLESAKIRKDKSRMKAVKKLAEQQRKELDEAREVI